MNVTALGATAHLYLGALGFCFAATLSGANADPIEYVDDWHVLKSSVSQALTVPETNFEVSISSKGFVFSSREDGEILLDMKKGVYDLYVMNPSPNTGYRTTLWLFKQSENELTQLLINWPDKEIIQNAMQWDFGSLEGIFENCDNHQGFEEQGIRLKENYFLTRFNAGQRPNSLNCTYLLGGGRCSLVYNKRDEWGVNDKLIFDQNFQYVGDIVSIEKTISSGCVLKSRLRLNLPH